MNECPYCKYIDGSNSNEELPGYDDSSYGEELYARVSGIDGRHPFVKYTRLQSCVLHD